MQEPPNETKGNAMGKTLPTKEAKASIRVIKLQLAALVDQYAEEIQESFKNAPDGKLAIGLKASIQVKGVGHNEVAVGISFVRDKLDERISLRVDESQESFWSEDDGVVRRVADELKRVGATVIVNGKK